MTSTVATPVKRGKDLLPESTFTRLVERIMCDERMEEDLAERVMDQALAFLATSAASDEQLAPSPTVDIGWHTFLLYTREYSEFCDRVAGRFLHHVPADAEAPALSAVELNERTVEAIQDAGYRLDAPLWAGVGPCTQCTEG